jgi:hypothetical protein
MINSSLKRLLRAFRPVYFGLLASVACLQAKPVPDNLGNGLDRLVASNVAIKEAAARGTKLGTFASTNGKVYTTEENAGLAALALSDNQDRLLVRINPSGKKDIDAMIRAMTAKAPSLAVTAVDPTYRGVGVMNAYVSIDDVPALASMSMVRSVILELKPRHSKAPLPQAPTASKVTIPLQPDSAPLSTLSNQLGTYTDQGIFQHRVTQLNQYYNSTAPFDYEGNNLSIACISNSFAANTAHPASLDVTNNDLPGGASNPRNTTPVFVLQDDMSDNTSDDEGRGMCQVVYKMAPKAKVGFATADNGEVGFANAIRGLAGINSSTFPNASIQGFAADVIADDVGYFDEPFYEDGIIGAGVNDVAAAGVSYFSSAGNDIGIDGYESVIRVVPNGTGLTAAAGNTALAGTNIDLTNVPAGLYAGGFHNFNPNPGQLDVAQTVNMGSSSNNVPTILQWNDPYDQNTAISGETILFTSSGNYVATDITFTVTTPVTQGTFYQVVEAATGGSGFDGIVTVYKSDGVTVIAGPQDNGVDETLRFAAPANDTGFVVKVGHFSTTTGAFSLTVSSFTGFTTPSISSDWNLLAFRTDTGAYVPASSLTTNNIFTNEPVEIGIVNRTSAGTPSIQFVLARSNMPSGPNVADHIRYLLPGNGLSGYGPQEYFTYNTVTTSGHAHAVGCNGTAAYAAFRPSIPEDFTSPGPATIYFDANQNRLAAPEIRLQPRFAAMDGGNISANEGLAGLGTDDSSDFDAAANFYGTSAAAPHAAACALLVLEAAGGRHSVTPAQMTQLLQSTTFPHDLDPNSSSSVVNATNGGQVTLTFNSDNESNAGTGLNDLNSLSVAYAGASNITSIVFNPQGTASTGGNVTGGNNGLDPTNVYFSNIYPGMVWSAVTKAFTVSPASVGLVQTDAAATFSNAPAAGQAPTTTAPRTMTLTFPNANFTSGKILRFTVGRGVEHNSSVTGTVPGIGPTGGASTTQYSADLFGGGVVIPDAYDSATGTYSTNPHGMTFTVNFADGTSASGTLDNQIGSGYSVTDGYGFINAEAAAKQGAPGATPTPTATATATATPVATATATATPVATATATPATMSASQTVNLSTRMVTDTGNNVGIGGFIITGSVAKHVIIRAIGPSLTRSDFTASEVLADPTLEVHGPGSFGTITNNNWRDSQEAQIKADGLAPTNDLEAAIDAILPPGAYTAIVSGNGNPAGICLFEVYDLDTTALSKLANLSTRAFTGNSNNVVIAGFVLGNNQGIDRVAIRGLGPSLSSFGVADTLADPILELRDENGTLVLANNDWQDNATQAAEISSSGLAPSNTKEAAIAATLPPGLYTAILAGVNNGTGVGTVEVYDRGP